MTLHLIDLRIFLRPLRGECEAQTVLDGIVANPYADALFALGDTLCEMFDQLRA